jgi:isoamylase
VGEEMREENWSDPHARCLGVLLDGRAQETGIRRVGDDSTLLIVVNSHTDGVPFTLPKAAGGSHRIKLLDTHKPGRALLLFLLQPARTP